MEQGHVEAQTVGGTVVHVGSQPVTVVGDVEMREHDTLGESCGPGCVLHHGDVVDIHRVLPFLVILIGYHDRKGLDLAHGIHSAVLYGPQEYDLLEVGVRLAVEVLPGLGEELGYEIVNRLDIVGVPDTVYEEKDIHIRLLEHIIQFFRLIIGVDRQEDGTDLRGSEHQGDPIRDVRRPDSDLHALLNTHRHETFRYTVDLYSPFLPGKTKLPVDVHDRIVVWVIPNALIEKVS